MSDEVKEMTVDEIQRGYDANDLDIINGVIQGKIKTRKEPSVQTDVPAEKPDLGATQTIETPTETNIEPVENDTSIIVKHYEEEQARLKRLADDLERQKREETERALIKEQEFQKKIEEERKRSKELEDRIRASVPSEPTDKGILDDEPFASDFSKKTRELVEQLQSQSPNKEDVALIKAELQRIKDREAAEDAKRKEEAERRRKEEAEQRLFEDINRLQKSYPELQSRKDFREMTDEFNEFRGKLVNTLGVTNPVEQDKLVMKYLDPEKGAELRRDLETTGIKPPDDVEKFVQLAGLVDMTRGIEYDPVTEKFVEVKNSYGDPVRYRSIEEAYRVKYFYNEINNAKKKVLTQVKNKLDVVQTSAQNRISNSQSAPIEEGLSKEAAGQIIQSAELYVYDKNKYETLKRAYAKLNLAPPEYRGKR